MNIISNFPEENKEIRSGFKYYFPLIAFMTACFLAMLALVWRVCQMPIEYEELIGEPIPEVKEVEAKEAPAEETEVQVHMTDDDIIAAVVMAEAGNQDMLGMVAVATVILNRCDYYNLSVTEVVEAPNQFSYPYYGKVSRSAYRAVEIARENRDLLPSTLMWFRTGTYHDIGQPYEKLGDHYFSFLGE